MFLFLSRTTKVRELSDHFYIYCCKIQWTYNRFCSFGDDYKIEKKLKIELGHIDDSDERVQEARRMIQNERMMFSPAFVDDDWVSV